MNSYVAKVLSTIKERRSDYAHPSANHQLTADLLSAWLTHKTGQEVSLSAEDVCVINVLQKLSRLAHVSKDDSWLDVVGYAENVAMLNPDQRNTALVVHDANTSSKYPVLSGCTCALCVSAREEPHGASVQT